MILTKVIAALMIASVSTSPRFIDPFQPGPYEVIHHNISSGTYEGMEENLGVYTPVVDGMIPVLYFLDGFAMAIPEFAYSEIVTHMASHGMIVIVPWMLKLLTPEHKIPYFTAVMEWAEANLEDLLHNSSIPYNTTLDFQTLFATSHSAGSHVMVSLLKEGCGNFKGLVLMSPVDGADPNGIIPEFCITPGQELNFAIPTLHIEAGYDPEPGVSGQACGPEELSNERFWAALNSESHRWSINASEFAHADCLDEPFRKFVEVTGFCGINDALPQEVFPTYRTFVAGTHVAFFKALTEENCEEYLPFLEDPSIMLINATERHFNPTATCPTLYCNWEPLPQTTPSYF